MNSSSLIIPLMLAAMAVFMFVSIRNQKKRAAAAAEMQSSVVPGSRVQLHCGLFGVVVDSSDGDVVHIEIAPGVVTEWNRLAIREAVSEDDGADNDEKELDDFEVPDSLEGLDDSAGSDKPNLNKSDSDGDTSESESTDKPDEK